MSARYKRPAKAQCPILRKAVLCLGSVCSFVYNSCARLRLGLQNLAGPFDDQQCPAMQALELEPDPTLPPGSALTPAPAPAPAPDLAPSPGTAERLRPAHNPAGVPNVGLDGRPPKPWDVAANGQEAGCPTLCLTSAALHVS